MLFSLLESYNNLIIFFNFSFLRIIRDFFGVTFKIENFEPIKNEEMVHEEQEENNIPMPKYKSIEN